MLSVFSANTYELLEKLRNRKIDMAVVRTPFLIGELEAEYLYDETMVAVGKARFFKNAGRETVSLEELADVPVILYRRWQKVIESTFEARGLSPLVCCVNDDSGMTLNLALGGLGVGLIPPSGLPGKLPEGIVALKIDSAALVSRIALVCNEKEQLPEPAKLFWKIAVE